MKINLKTINSLLNKNKIRADIMTKWSKETNKNCRFVPGDSVRVYSKTTKRQAQGSKVYRFRGMTGKVIAASTVDGGTSMQSYAGNRFRGNTRYYVAFDSGDVIGVQSWLLNPIK